MCNLYSITKNQSAIIQIARAMRDRAGNLPPLICLITTMVTLFLGSTTMVLSAPNESMRSNCGPDRERLCGAFSGNPSEMQKCMIAHRAEWSPQCRRSAHKTKCFQHVQNHAC